MKLFKIYKELCSNFSQFSFEIENISIENIDLRCWIKLPNTLGDKNLFICINIKQDNFAIYISGDKLEKNLQSLSMLNEYNANANGFKAYINDNGEICLWQTEGYKSEKSAVEKITVLLFSALFGEQAINYLKPILDITY